MHTNPTRLTSTIVSQALDLLTPIMLANHIYWNLNAFQAATIANDTLVMPYADRIIGIDTLEVPTGALESVTLPWQSPSLPLNFTQEKMIGQGLDSMQCGYGCVGIDNAFIMDRPRNSWSESTDIPLLQMTGAATGIRLTLKTNQHSLQLYSCNGQNGTIPIKTDQMNGAATDYVQKYGCM